MSFSLNTTNSAFNERQKSVFDQLGVLEKNRKNVNSTEMDVDEKEISPTDKKLKRAVTKQFRGKESIFKKPTNPIPKNFINKIPDFKKNPHKWTKYSLDDVRDEDISDKGNTKAALSFLNELKTRKSLTSNEDAEGDNKLPEKIIFKKHINLKPKVENLDEEKPSFHSSKVVMPEYVVGQKVQKEKKNKLIRNSQTKELKLSHLMQDEEDDE